MYNETYRTNKKIDYFMNCNNDYKVSIIVPIYNVGQSVYKCISSLISQTYNKIEIILVDDGSTDDSGTIAKEFTNKDKRIIYIKQENGGVTSARKTGWQNSSGEYCLFVDADDFLENDAIEFFINKISKYKYDFVTGWYDIIYENGEKESVDSPHINGEYNAEEYVKMSISRVNGFNSIWIGIYKRELFDEEVFNIDRNIYRGEDSTTLIGVLNKMDKILVTDKIFYHYFQRVDSVTHTKSIDLKYLYNLLEFQYNRIKFKNLFLPLYFRTLISYYYIAQEKEERIQLKSLIRKLYRKELFKKLNFNQRIKIICFYIRPLEYLLRLIIIKRYNEKYNPNQS